MLKTFLNKIWLVIYFVVGALILEAITFRVLGLGIMPEYFFYNFVLILSIGFLVYLIPNYTAQYVVFTVILFIQAAFCYVNVLLQFAYHDLFSIEMVRLIWAAGKAMTTSFVDFSVLLQLLCVFFVLAITGAGVRRLCKREKIDKKQHFSIVVIVVLILVQSYSWAFYFNQRSKINNLADIKNSDYISSDTFLLNTEIMKTNSYKKFGTYGYLSNLIANYNKGIEDSVKKACIAYFDGGSIYGVGDNKSQVFGADDIKENKNNLIIVMMESLEWFAFGDGTYDPNLNNLSDELTPNVYEVIYGKDNTKGTADDSLVASNFFAKSKTNVSEGFAILGNYPVGKLFRDITGKKYNESLGAFDYSLPHILKKEGYITSYVHTNEISYYHRSSTHYNLGFDYVIGKDMLRDENGNKIYTGSDLNWNHWNNEADVVEDAMEYIVPEGDTPFMTMYLNVSTHGPYDNKHNKDYDRYKYYVMYGPKNCEFNSSLGIYELKSGVSATADNYSTWYKNVVDNDNFSNSFKKELLNWQCGVIGLDESIGLILDELEAQGKYDTTDILLYSDHNAYYDNMSLKIKGLPESEVYGVENNTIPFVLSSPGLKTKYGGQYVLNDRFCSAYDIIPTILDLYGISFNENLYLGNSLFNPIGDIYSLGDKTVINDMVVYYSNTGGLYSKNMYTFDMENFEYYKADMSGTTSAERQDLLNRFKSVATKTLIKVNYLNLLNKYYLYPQLTNK